MIDYWSLAKEFKAGNFVQKINPINGDLSPYMGRVTAVLRGIGCLDVQWPFGNERVFPDDVVLVDPKYSRVLPPALLDQTLLTTEIEKARTASTSPWKTQVIHPVLYVEMARYWHKGASEVIAYDDLYRKYGSAIPEAAIRSEVGTFYRLGRNAGVALVASEAKRQGFQNREAAYWVAQNRTFRATDPEMKAGKPNCPRCANRMRRATYKMHKGSRVKLFACGKCLYLLDPTSIVGPDGQPHSWF